MPGQMVTDDDVPCRLEAGRAVEILRQETVHVHVPAPLPLAVSCAECGSPSREPRNPSPAWLHSGDMAEFFDAVERAQLSDLFDGLGPQAPTLLEPWVTRDLAAHLVLRERDYIAGPGLVLPGGWGRLAERRRRALALRDFTWLSATIRSGPPPGFFRIRWVRRVPNLNEFFVHHEDVRRANGRGPRTNEHALDVALWRNVSRAPWFLARRLHGAGLELQWAGTAQTVRARRGEPVARIAGPPGELLLYLFGRQSAAHVEVSGPDAAIEAVRRTRFGM
jgi:uncharacterized protein (TIGR03085 family)